MDETNTHSWQLWGIHLAVYCGLWAALQNSNFEHQAAFSFALMLTLIWISVVDFSTRLISNLANLLLFLIGLLFVATVSPENVAYHMVGAVVWGGLFWGIALVYERARGEIGLGLGDVKLMFGTGIWLGPILPIYVVLIASLSGCITMLAQSYLRGSNISRSASIAFGPFLALSLWGVWLWQVRKLEL